MDSSFNVQITEKPFIGEVVKETKINIPLSKIECYLSHSYQAQLEAVKGKRQNLFFSLDKKAQLSFEQYINQYEPNIYKPNEIGLDNLIKSIWKKVRACLRAQLESNGNNKIIKDENQNELIAKAQEKIYKEEQNIPGKMFTYREVDLLWEWITSTQQIPKENKNKS